MCMGCRIAADDAAARADRAHRVETERVRKMPATQRDGTRSELARANSRAMRNYMRRTRGAMA